MANYFKSFTVISRCTISLQSLLAADKAVKETGITEQEVLEELGKVWEESWNERNK